jgi:hypothetical protein
MRRMLLIALVCAGFAAAPAGADTASPAGGANNVVLVQTQSDGQWNERSHVQVAPVAGDTVASTNLAVAQATGCTGCRASAVAVQVLFVTGDPSVYTPSNVATAANGGCDTCGTYAYAWQYLLQTSGPAYLSPTGRLEVNQLGRQIADAVASIDPTSLAADQQLTDRLDALTAQLKTVVDDEVRLAGGNPSGAPRELVRTG